MRTGYICFDNSCVAVEIPTTQEEIRRGLMNRAILPEENGMLFIFDRGRVHKLWMKNMLIPIDVIWLDDEGIIVHIDKNVIPCDTYCEPFGQEQYTKFALELNGGYTDRHNINVGDNARMIL